MRMSPTTFATVALCFGTAPLYAELTPQLLKSAVLVTANEIGWPPSRFRPDQTGQGGPGRWLVVPDETAPHGSAIEQSTNDQTEERFPLAIYDAFSAANLKAAVSTKIVSGRMRSAGLAIRVVDASNYYLVRISALEQRIDLLRCDEGQLRRIAGADAPILIGTWEKLTVIAERERFDVWLNDHPIFSVVDYGRLRAGQVALWTEEDNVTRFQGLEVEPLRASGGD